MHSMTERMKLRLFLPIRAKIKGKEEGEEGRLYLKFEANRFGRIFVLCTNERNAICEGRSGFERKLITGNL